MKPNINVIGLLAGFGFISLVCAQGNALGLGHDDKHIATVDADGVALAAIQGLNQKLEAEVKTKDARIAALEQRLSALESLLRK